MPDAVRRPSPHQGKPELIIGNHRLIGAVQALSKPLAVFARRRQSGDTAGTAAEEGDGAGSNTWYEVQGFVHKKLVFKKRPRPIVRAAQRG